MLYAPAVCENCSTVFASTELIAEGHAESSSYRRSAGPCPRCGSRGAIPEWVFRFHTIATIAIDQATPEQLRSVVQALRTRSDNPPAANRTTIADLTNQLTGPWSRVALELRQARADQRSAKLAFLLWIMDAPARAGHAVTRLRSAQTAYAAGDHDLRSGLLGVEVTPPNQLVTAVVEPSIRRAS
jgi:hypothetical protein